MAPPTPLPPHREQVRQEWIDYNGHLSEAYYVLVFGHATDALMDHIGLDAGYRERTGCSLYTVEAHVRYLREVSAGSTLTLRTRLLGAAGGKVHFVHEMYAAPPTPTASPWPAAPGAEPPAPGTGSAPPGAGAPTGPGSDPTSSRGRSAGGAAIRPSEPRAGAPATAAGPAAASVGADPAGAPVAGHVGKLVATEELFALHVDQRTGRSVPLPETARRQLLAHAEPPPPWAGRGIQPVAPPPTPAADA